MKWRCEIRGTMTVEAPDEESAKETAGQRPVEEWDWDGVEAEEDE